MTKMKILVAAIIFGVLVIALTLSIGARGEQDDLIVEGGFKTFAISPDGKTIAASSGKGSVVVYLAETLEEIAKFSIPDPKPTHEVWGVGFSPDCKNVFAWGQDLQPWMWDIEGKRAPRVFGGHVNGAELVTFHPNGKTLMTVDVGESLRSIDVSTGEVLKKAHVRGNGNFKIIFYPGGNRFLLCNPYGLSLWDFESLTEIEHEMVTFNFFNEEQGKDGHARLITGAALAPKDLNLLTTDWDGKLLEWGPKQKLIRTIFQQPKKIKSLNVSDGKLLIGGGDGFARLIRYENGQEIRKLPAHGGLATMAENGRIALTFSKRNGIHVWKLK